MTLPTRESHFLLHIEIGNTRWQDAVKDSSQPEKGYYIIGSFGSLSCSWTIVLHPQILEAYYIVNISWISWQSEWKMVYCMNSKLTYRNAYVWICIYTYKSLFSLFFSTLFSTVDADEIPAKRPRLGIKY